MLSAMLDFFTIAITLPALPFTVAVAITTTFWVVSLVAGFDFGTDGADGVLDGAVDGALDGAVDGAMDGAVDGALDGALDSAADGVGEAVDGLADGAADGVGAHHGAEVAGADGGTDLLAMAATMLGLGKVPITVWLSLFTLWGWMVAFVGGWLLRSPLLVFLPSWPGNLAVLAVATVGGVVLARITSRPLEPVYRSHGGRKRDSLVGEVAEITTSRVDARFGQARVEVGSDDLVIQVRCDHANPLTRGTRALVVQFDTGRDAFVVEPLDSAKQTVRTTSSVRETSRVPAREHSARHLTGPSSTFVRRALAGGNFRGV